MFTVVLPNVVVFMFVCFYLPSPRTSQTLDLEFFSMKSDALCYCETESKCFPSLWELRSDSDWRLYLPCSFRWQSCLGCVNQESAALPSISSYDAPKLKLAGYVKQREAVPLVLGDLI